jgi:electron transfer flavoprotein alpha subunit
MRSYIGQSMIALIPVRCGVLPAGADEVIAECAGRVVVVGSGIDELTFDGLATAVWTAALGDVEFGRWSAVLPSLVEFLDDADGIVLPNSPDGRDLAPRLAATMNRPLFAGATMVTDHLVKVARRGGLELHELHPTGPFVATLQPGIRGAEPFDAPALVESLGSPGASDSPSRSTGRPFTDVRVVTVLPPDVRTMDLTEANRIVGGGAGLATEAQFGRLDEFADQIGGVMGATRVITDRGWVHHDRQIGTTGAVVDPELYVAFGVSGAVQHTSGLGDPAHIVSVNTDPHCPMMAMSDLAIVSDANATLDALVDLLRRRSSAPGTSSTLPVSV